MEVSKWHAEISRRIRVPDVLALIRSYVYIPPHKTVQDHHLLNEIERHFKTRILPSDEVVMLNGDVQISSTSGYWIKQREIGMLQSAIICGEYVASSVLIHSRHSLDADARIDFDGAETCAMNSIPSDCAFLLPDARLNFAGAGTLALYVPFWRNDPNWLVLRTRSFIGSTSARRCLFYCIDERRFRCPELQRYLRLQNTGT